MSEDDFTAIERLQLRQARLQRELEYLEMAENVSSLEFKVENLRKRLGVSPEQLSNCNRPLPASEQSVIPPTTVSPENTPGATLGHLPGAGVPETSVSRPTVSEAMIPEPTEGAPVASIHSTQGSMPNNPIAPSVTRYYHSAIDGQARMSSVSDNAMVTSIFSALELKYFKGPILLDSDEEHFVAMDLEDLQSSAEAMEQSEDKNWKLLGYIHYRIYMKTKTVTHLNQAIEKTEMALKDLSVEPAEYWNVMRRLIVILTDGFDSAQRSDKLEKAINYGEEMIIITKSWHSDYSAIVEDIFRIKSRRILESLSGDDLKKALERASIERDMAMQVNDVLDENRDLDAESGRLFRAFEQTGEPEHLDRAIEVAEDAIARTADCHILKPARLSNLARRFIARFRLKNTSVDLDKAIERGEEALALAPSDHPHRRDIVMNMAGFLASRFWLKGNPEDLRLFNIWGQETIQSSEKNDPSMSRAICNISSCFLMRYKQVNDPEDLARGIKWIQEALKLESPDHPINAAVWHTAAIGFLNKFSKEKQPDDLKEAIQMSKNSLNAPLEGGPFERVPCLALLSAIYCAGFDHLGDSRYLDLSIEQGKQALQEITTEDFPSSIIQSNLSDQLSRRFKLTGNTQDLEDAISYAESAVGSSWPAEPNRASKLDALAQGLNLRDGNANERVAGLWEEAAQLTAATPTERIKYAIQAYESLCALRSWNRARNVIMNAVPLLSQVAPRQLAQLNQQSNLEEFDFLTTLATAAALHEEGGGEEKAAEAIRLSELGRGVITGLRFGMRPDLDALRKKHRDLAAQFEELRDKLESPMQDGPISGFGSGDFALPRETNDRHELSSQLDDVTRKIRLRHGFGRFQLPPTTEELQSTASLGPIVVINVCEARCDALIVRSQSIHSLRLPHLQYNRLLQMVEGVKTIRRLHSSSSQRKASLSDILEWLWDVAVGPILENLGYHDRPHGKWPRVWWIPTGPLSLLPLHAAGYHSSSSNKSALDRVISSYSSSIKALQYSRQVLKTNSRLVIDRPALLISMPTTPGQTALRFAGKEVDELDKLLPDKIERSRLSLPTTQEVIDGLADCSIFHFAGHGESHSVTPSKSLLLTKDWNKNPLTVEKLFDLNLSDKSPCLAYLSACSTNDNNTEKLHDEAIHLVTACQLAGFQHVVGTMWEVDDEYCVDAAKEVYKEIMTDYDGTIDGAKIALGVHQAVRHLRDISDGRKTARDANPELDSSSGNEETDVQANQGESQRKLRPWGYREEVQTEGNDPLIWAAYVHVGP